MKSNFEAAGVQLVKEESEQVRFDEEKVFAFGDMPGPCIAQLSERKMERDGEAQLHLNLPHDGAIAGQCETYSEQDYSDNQIQVNLPIDVSSTKSSSSYHGSDKFMMGQEYLQGLAQNSRVVDEEHVNLSSLNNAICSERFEELNYEMEVLNEEIEIPEEIDPANMEEHKR